MRRFTKREDTYSVPILPDESGFLGRECPNNECLGYFKVKLGTGLAGESNCYCPYCGHNAPHNQFFTKDQIEYARSVALHDATNQVITMLKGMECKPDPRALIGIGIEVKGQQYPLHYYTEKQLEQEVVCDKCSLVYTIYGIFGYCPDCGAHNSLHILNMNLNIVEKMINLSDEYEKSISQKLIENALKEAVSSFDGFGRELCKIYSIKSNNPKMAQAISFQNISNSKDKIIRLFGIDISKSISAGEWTAMAILFQKRHLFTHKMGIIDQEYIDKTGENNTLIGKKVEVNKNDVFDLINGLRLMGSYLYSEIEKK